ncbi:MAG: FtsX-like permease family protein [Ruminococcus sp.]|nr:hypothetical protein [Bacillota bacterium]
MNGQKETFLFIGFFLAALLGIIGISNLINTIASDVFSRKIELASMQSIGMTKKQLWAMLLNRKCSLFCRRFCRRSIRFL